MDEEISKALNGELDESGLQALESKLSESGKQALKEALAFRNKKRDEESKAEEARKAREAEESRLAEIKLKAQVEEDKLKSTQESVNQFRSEQISKAKNKFFTDYGITDEQREIYEATFKKFDSGKVDPDLIYDDFVGVYAALNKESLFEAKKKIEEMQKNADLHNESQAGTHSNPPGGEKKSEVSDKAKKLAQEAGISEESADRITKEGYSRTLE